MARNNFVCRSNNTTQNDVLMRVLMLVDQSSSAQYSRVGDRITGILSIANIGDVPLSNIQIAKNVPDLYFSAPLTGVTIQPNQQNNTVEWIYYVTQDDIDARSVNAQTTVSGTNNATTINQLSTIQSDPNGESPLPLSFVSQPPPTQYLCQYTIFTENAPDEFTFLGGAPAGPTTVDEDRFVLACTPDLPANSTTGRLSFTINGRTNANACDLDMFVRAIKFPQSGSFSAADMSAAKIDIRMSQAEWGQSGGVNITFEANVDSLIAEVTSDPTYVPAEGICFVIGTNNTDASCAPPTIQSLSPCLISPSQYEILEYDYVNPPPQVHVEAVMEAARRFFNDVVTVPLPIKKYGNLLTDKVFSRVNFTANDGPGGSVSVVNLVVPRETSPTDYTSLYSEGVVDTADSSVHLDNYSQMYDIIRHDVMHTLGFVGSTLVAAGIADCTTNTYTGATGVAEYSALTGNAEASVPISSLNCNHWEDGVFDAELMSATFNNGIKNPMSRVSLAVLADIGYQGVVLTGADPYSL